MYSEANGENNSLRRKEEAGLAMSPVARGGATATHTKRGGWSEKKIDLFDGFWWTTSKTLCFFFFSSYRTVNVVPFYLAVFPYFVVVIIHEKS